LFQLFVAANNIFGRITMAVLAGQDGLIRNCNVSHHYGITVPDFYSAGSNMLLLIDVLLNFQTVY